MDNEDVDYLGVSYPMEVDSPIPRPVSIYGKVQPCKKSQSTLKNDDFSAWTSVRSPSLPALTGRPFNCDQERNGISKDILSYVHPISPCRSLNRSISYEQCYVGEMRTEKNDPYVKVCKIEQKLECYSPKIWKKTVVVETLTYNQEPDCSKRNVRSRSLTSNGEERIASDTKMRNAAYPAKTLPFSADHKTLNRNFRKFLFFLAIPAFLLLFSGMMHHRPLLVSTQCKGQLDIKNIEVTLMREIYGQNLALTSFIDALKEIFFLSEEENNSTMNVIMLIGGTGVGKSFMASLINELYPKNWEQIFLNAQVDLIQEDSKLKILQEITNKITDCGTNLIVVDDAADFLRSLSNINQNNFMHQLYFTADNSGKKILLVLMLNDKKGEHLWNDKIQLTKHVEEYNKLLKRMGDIQTYVVQFTPLQREHIVKCIRQSLEKENRAVLDEEIYSLLEKESSETFPNGCKGIYKYVHELSTKSRSDDLL